MPGTFFFVHGTGVRQSGYEATLTRIRRGCAKQPALRDIQVADNCNWGEDVGTRLDLLPLVLPPEERSRAIAAVAEAADIELTLWRLLLEDPLFELRLAAQQPAKSVSAFGHAGPDVELAAAMERLAANPPDAAAAGIPAPQLVAAIARVRAAAELAPAAIAAGDAAEKELVEAVARAVVAFALASAPADEPRPTAALDRGVRDALVAAIALQLAPTTRGFGGWLKDKVKDAVAGIATHELKERRQKLTGGSLETVGDIFFHLRRGGLVLDYIAGKIQAWEPPIVAVGHSLGGIMLVDLLTRADAPAVAKLVTVGSQSPLFFAVDSLESLRPFGLAATAPFVPWLNIYDRNDFLSYLAKDVFAAAAGIDDQEVKSGVPFPDAHSAYWENDRTYELIASFWP